MHLAKNMQFLPNSIPAFITGWDITSDNKFIFWEEVKGYQICQNRLISSEEINKTKKKLRMKNLGIYFLFYSTERLGPKNWHFLSCVSKV